MVWYPPESKEHRLMKVKKDVVRLIETAERHIGSRAEIARKLGVARTTISQWADITGRKIPSLRHYKALEELAKKTA